MSGIARLTFAVIVSCTGLSARAQVLRAPLDTFLDGGPNVGGVSVGNWHFDGFCFRSTGSIAVDAADITVQFSGNEFHKQRLFLLGRRIGDARRRGRLRRRLPDRGHLPLRRHRRAAPQRLRPRRRPRRRRDRDRHAHPRRRLACYARRLQRRPRPRRRRQRRPRQPERGAGPARHVRVAGRPRRRHAAAPVLRPQPRRAPPRLPRARRRQPPRPPRIAAPPPTHKFNPRHELADMRCVWRRRRRRLAVVRARRPGGSSRTCHVTSPSATAGCW